ncbi:AAA family ATPase [uncultured Thiocystis sp.]|jgi:hypothetical protein|uniref:AAA family ATPase n=1 Tax=uncultured Thiocystis sp. TaxID=1202134 RepID=UPI0025D006C5|nr:AAA family ATPase [uncultured Thiocystis sp.]
MHRRQLPIGIQTFAKIREADHYYVDKTGFIRRLIDEGSQYFLSRPRRFGKSLLIDTIAELFAGNELDALRRHLESLFAAIPHQWHTANPIAQYEGYYASVFYSHLAALGLDLTAEDATQLGRIDLTLKFNARIWLFEFKVVELAPAGRALQQIKERGDADKYRTLGQPIHLIGIEFSRERRTLVGFETETL